jgi:hypothetical protein
VRCQLLAAFIKDNWRKGRQSLSGRTVQADTVAGWAAATRGSVATAARRCSMSICHSRPTFSCDSGSTQPRHRP